MEDTIKSLGKLGVLTCYRIGPFITLLNREARNFKYEFKQKLEDHTDLFDIQTKDGSIFFTVDEWGNLIKCGLGKEEKGKVKSDLLNLRRYLIQSIFRTIAFKSVSYKDLNLNVNYFFNGVITPVFLEAYNFYDLEWNFIFDELRKDKVPVKSLFGKKELGIDVTNSKEKLTISCDGNKVIIPKIKINIPEFTEDYKPRALIVDYLEKYWIVPHKESLPISFLMDPFDLGRPIQFFSECLINEAKTNKNFKNYWEENESIKKSRISIPETILEGKDDVLFSIAGGLCAQLFSNFAKVYAEKFK